MDLVTPPSIGWYHPGGGRMGVQSCSLDRTMTGTITKEAIWDRLAAHGAPLGAEQAISAAVTGETLIKTLDDAVRDLNSRPGQSNFKRKQEALEALLLAISFHHRSVFETFPDRIRFQVPDKISGRHIKLKRIASAYLAKYL